MSICKVAWTLEQQEWLIYIARRYKEGATQPQIAFEKELRLHTMRSRMQRLGVRFERNGLKLVFLTTGEPVDFEALAIITILPTRQQ